MRIKSRILSLLVGFLFLGAITTSCGKTENDEKKEDKTEEATDTTTETPEDIVVESSSVNKNAKKIPTSLTSIKDVEVGDLDGDGDKDIVALSSEAGKVEILQNHGGGNFTSTVANVNDAEKVARGDLTGDGIEDLLVASNTSLNVVLNTLSSSNSLSLTSFSLEAFGIITDEILTKIASMLIADLDKDGDNDIVAAVTTSDKEDKVLIFENDGDTNSDGVPVFIEIEISSNILGDLETITEVRAADIDGDDDLDLIFSGADSDGAPLVNLITKVDDSEDAHEFEPVDLGLDFSDLCDDLNSTDDACEITDLEVLDVEKDTDLDFSFLFEKGDEKSLVFATQEDDDTFEIEDVTPKNEDDIQSLSIEDVDGDDDSELILSTCSGESSSDDEIKPMEHEIIWDVDENDLFAVTIFDLPGCDDDNEDDFIEFDMDNLDWFSDDKSCGKENDLFVSNGDELLLFADADTTEKAGTEMTADELSNGAEAIVSIDADGDGNIDLVAATEDDGLVLLTNNAGDSDEDTENFTSSAISDEEENADLGEVSSITAVDVDGDGDDDLVVSGTKGVSTWLNTAGDFVKKNSSILGDIGSKALNFFTTSLGDVDGDGDTDILATGDTDGDGENEAVLLSNDGTGSFTPSFDIVKTGTSLVKSVLGDMGGDGILDIFTTSKKADDGGDKNLASSAISLFIGLGSSLFGAEKKVADTPSGCEATDIASVDSDSDEDDDIVVSDECGNLTIAKDDKDDADEIKEVTVPAEAMGSNNGSPITSLIKTGVGALTALVSPKEPSADDGSETESKSSPMDIVKSAVTSDAGQMLVSTATKAIGGLFSNFGSSNKETTVVETPVEEKKKDSGGFFSSLVSGASKIFSFF